MCSRSEAGSYLRLIDVVYHSTLGLRVIKKREASFIFFFLITLEPFEKWPTSIEPWRGLSVALTLSSPPLSATVFLPRQSAESCCHKSTYLGASGIPKGQPVHNSF